MRVQRRSMREDEPGNRRDGNPGCVREYPRLRQFVWAQPLRGTAVGDRVAQGAGHARRAYRRRFNAARSMGTWAWRARRGIADGHRVASRALILESGCYDPLTLWPDAPLRTKLAILREVWPSKRILKEDSVIAHLPAKLDVSVLIMHGQQDNRMPVRQAVKLADALRARGAKVETLYFPRASHDLGKRVEPELRAFLRDNLLGTTSAAAS